MASVFKMFNIVLHQNHICLYNRFYIFDFIFWKYLIFTSLSANKYLMLKYHLKYQSSLYSVSERRFLACLLYSAVGSSLTIFQQSPASIDRFHFLWYLFSIAAMSWWNRPLCSSFTSPQFNGKKVYLQWHIEWHIAAKGFAGLREVYHQLLIIIYFVVSKKLCCYWLTSFSSLLFFPIQQMIKSIISKEFTNLWSHKDPFFDFCFAKSSISSSFERRT